jgi:uncharacterized protein (DUF58 family)
MPTSDYGPLLDALRGVHWPARLPAPGGPTGAHHSRMRGSSAEFTEYRTYRQGDDPRRIDWKLLARSDRAYIRLATERTVLRTMLVVDASASMAYPQRTLAKWAAARRLAVGLAAVAHADGDPVGLVAPGARGVRRLPPRTRRGVVAEIARTLDEMSPAGGAALAPAVTALAGPGRVAVVSDFLSGEDDVVRAIRQCVVAGGEVQAVHVIACEELDPPTLGVLATDPEDATVRRPLVDASRAEYVAAFAAWREQLARAVRDAGAGYTAVATDEPSERAVRRIVAPRAAIRAEPGTPAGAPGAPGTA